MRVADRQSATHNVWYARGNSQIARQVSVDGHLQQPNPVEGHADIHPPSRRHLSGRFAKWTAAENPRCQKAVGVYAERERLIAMREDAHRGLAGINARNCIQLDRTKTGKARVCPDRHTVRLIFKSQTSVLGRAAVRQVLGRSTLGTVITKRRQIDGASCKLIGVMTNELPHGCMPGG